MKMINPNQVTSIREVSEEDPDPKGFVGQDPTKLVLIYRWRPQRVFQEGDELVINVLGSPQVLDHYTRERIRMYDPSILAPEPVAEEDEFAELDFDPGGTPARGETNEYVAPARRVRAQHVAYTYSPYRPLADLMYEFVPTAQDSGRAANEAAQRIRSVMDEVRAVPGWRPFSVDPVEDPAEIDGHILDDIDGRILDDEEGPF